MIDKLLIIGALVHIMRLVLIELEISRPRRRWWVRPTNRSRNKFGFHETCIKKLLRNDQDDLFKAARMDEDKFNFLLSLLKEKLSRRSQREPIQPEMRLAVTLMYLAHGCSFQVLARRFGKGILQNTLPVPESRNLPGSAVCFPYYFVGDNAFPLRVNVMRPYPGRILLTDKSHYNKTLSTARVRIEMAFGILANRWRILQTKIHAEPKNVNKIVLATVLLHNFLMLQKTSNYYSADDMDTFESTPLNRITTFSNRSSQRAFVYRDVLKDYLNRNSTNEEIQQ